MRVSLGTFACSCIKAHFGGDVSTVVETALDRYAERLESRSQGLPVPRFWFERSEAEIPVEFDVPVSPWKRQLLGAEARKQGLPVEQLLTHAVFLYLASDRLQSRKNLRPRVVT